MGLEAMKLTGQKGSLVAINQDFRNGGIDPNLDMNTERLLSLTRFHQAVAAFPNYLTVRYMAGLSSTGTDLGILLQHDGITGTRRIL